MINKQANHPPYSIELWYEDKKVFFFEWDDGEHPGAIVNFRRGDWEQQILGKIEDDPDLDTTNDGSPEGSGHGTQ